MKRSVYVLVSLLVLTLATGPSFAKTKMSKPKPTNIAPENMKWVDDPAVPGVKIAVLWGDPAKGPSVGVLQKWPAGTTQGMHWHSSTVRAVGVAGHLIVETANGEKVDLTPGAYGTMPSGTRHTTRCDAGADCMFFAQVLGKADTHPVK